MVFSTIVDRLLRLHEPSRAESIANVLRAFETVPAAPRGERRRLLRKVMAQDVARRVASPLLVRFARTARRAAAALPLVGAEELQAAGPGRPVIIALAHFGLAYVNIAALVGALRSRTVFVVHLDDAKAAATETFIRRLGAVPIRSTHSSLLELVLAIRENPNCAIVIGFDYLGGSVHHAIRFLGMPIMAPGGPAYLADRENGLVFTCWWELDEKGPRLVFGGPYATDGDADESARQARLTQRLFALLDRQIAKHPAQWTGWDVLGWKHVEARHAALIARQGAPGTSARRSA